MLRLFVCGLGISVGSTLALRLAGQHLLHPGDGKGTLLLFAASFPLMAWLSRRLCLSVQLPRERWLSGAVSLVLPTLVLDAFSSAFFPVMFPRMAPEAAGVFGGSMLWCCRGALVGVMIKGSGRA